MRAIQCMNRITGNGERERMMLYNTKCIINKQNGRERISHNDLLNVDDNDEPMNQSQSNFH